MIISKVTENNIFFLCFGIYLFIPPGNLVDNALTKAISIEMNTLISFRTYAV